MDIIKQLIQILIPSALVLYGMYLTTKSLISKQYQEKIIEHKKKYTEITLPLRLQAYERMILFLERIQIEQLLARIDYQKLDIAQIQHVLLNEIRSEYNHNLTQQIYVSHTVWVSIAQAKEQIITLVNHIAVGFQDKKDSDSIVFVKQLIETSMEDDILFQTQKALKEEVQQIFG